MSDLLFKRGQLSGLNALKEQGKIQNGTVYFTTDEGGMYIGLDSTTAKRVQGSVIYYETAQEFLAETKPPYSSDVLYFIANNKFVDGEYEAWNALIRWDATNEKFVQINVTASTVEALTARVAATEGNVSSIEAALGYDSTNKTWKTLDDLVAEDDRLQGEIDKINETLKGVATDTNLSALTDRVEAVENKASNLEATIGNIAEGKTVAGLISELDSKKANVSDLTALSGTVTTLSGTVTDINSRLGTAEGEIDDIQVSIGQLQAKDSELIESIGTKADASAVSALRERVEAVEGVNTTQNNRLDAVESRATTIEGEISNLQGRTKTLETEVTNLKDDSAKHVLKTEYEAHKAQFEALQTEVSKKATQSALDNAIADITINKNNISTINATLSTKADQSALNAAKTELQGNIDTVNSKVTQNATDIAALQGQIGGITDNENAISKLEDRVAANESGLADAQSDINTLSANKADKSEVSAINNKLGTIEDGKTVSELIAANAKGVSDNAVEIAKLVDADTTINESIDDLIQADKDINAAVALKADKSDLTALTGRVTKNETDISTNAVEIAKITADYLKSADKSELLGEITSKINAANAMTYKGGVGSLEAFNLIKAGEVSIGDTYIVTAPFTPEGMTGLYAGDLLIAGVKEGKSEDANGYIAEDDQLWTQVDTGYISAHESILDVQKVEATETTAEAATIRLSSYVNPDSGDLGAITIKGSENITITSTIGINNSHELNIGMQWGEF